MKHYVLLILFILCLSCNNDDDNNIVNDTIIPEVPLIFVCEPEDLGIILNKIDAQINGLF